MLEAVSRSLGARGFGYEGDRRPTQSAVDAARTLRNPLGEVRSFRAMLAASSERMAPVAVTVSNPRR